MTTETRPALHLLPDIAGSIADLPRLSCVIERFLADAARDTATADDFAAALDLDPELRGWVLRHANSGFCNLARPVHSVAEACVVVGMRPLTRMVYAACTRDLLDRPLRGYHLDARGFWLHGLAVGIASHRLAERLGPASPLAPEHAMVAGLLHDVGKLILDPLLPRRAATHWVTYADEQRLLGGDHAAVSAAILKFWNLPLEIVDVVAEHHVATDDPDVRLLAVADRLLGFWGVGTETYCRPDPEHVPADLADFAAPLAASAALLHAWYAELPPLVEGLEEMVRAIGHGAPPALPVHDDTSVAAPDTAAVGRRGQRRERRPSRRTRTRRR